MCLSVCLCVCVFAENCVCFVRCMRFCRVFHALDGSGHKCFFSVRTNLARHALMIVRWDSAWK